MTGLFVGSFQAPNGERWLKLLPGQLSESVLERLELLWGQRSCFVDLQSLKIVKRGNESYLLHPSRGRISAHQDIDFVAPEALFDIVSFDADKPSGLRIGILSSLP